ncbi:MAG: VOC family protein [Pseudomonadota bacterium]
MTERTESGQAPVEFTGCRPVLPVEDMAVSLDHYLTVLGFTEEWRWSGDEADPVPNFVSLFRGHFQLFLARRPSPIQAVEIVVGLRSVADVNQIHGEYSSSGAIVEEPPSARPWGTYEMRIRDPDRHLLRLLTNMPRQT